MGAIPVGRQTVIPALRSVGLTSDVAYAAAAASIGLSIAVWLFSRSEDRAHSERFGIFVGLWAPTFVGLGNALAEQEVKEMLPGS